MKSSEIGEENAIYDDSYDCLARMESASLTHLSATQLIMNGNQTVHAITGVGLFFSRMI